jgi:hypothetical protein
MPAVQSAGWDLMKQIRQEVKLRDGKVIVRGAIAMRTTVKSAVRFLYIFLLITVWIFVSIFKNQYNHRFNFIGIINAQ